MACGNARRDGFPFTAGGRGRNGGPARAYWRRRNTYEYYQEEVLGDTILGPGDRTRPGAGIHRVGGIKPDTRIVAERNRMAERSGDQQPVPCLWDDGRALYPARRGSPGSLRPSQTQPGLCGSGTWKATRGANRPLPALQRKI